MQFKLLIAAFVSLVAAQGSICFDAGDCLLAGGGQCVKASGQLLGSCAKSGSSGMTTSASAGAPAATGSVCFDAGDCILSGGGQCVKSAGSIFLGHCSK